MKGKQNRVIGLSADMQEEIGKARPHVLRRWFDDLERHGHVVLRTSAVKTAVYALTSWALVNGIVMAFAVTPISTWNPFAPASGDGGGPLQVVMGILLLAGFLLFGFGAVLWTFVIPVVRPRMVVSRWGVQSIGWRPGGTFTVFSAAWPDILQVGGFYTPTRWPFPDQLHVTLTARAEGVRRAPWIRVRAHHVTITYSVNALLRGRRREVLALLVHVQDAVR